MFDESGARSVGAPWGAVGLILLGCEEARSPRAAEPSRFRRLGEGGEVQWGHAFKHTASGTVRRPRLGSKGVTRRRSGSNRSLMYRPLALADGGRRAFSPLEALACSAEGAIMFHIIGRFCNRSSTRRDFSGADDLARASFAKRDILLERLAALIAWKSTQRQGLQFSQEQVLQGQACQARPAPTCGGNTSARTSGYAS